MKQRYQPLTDEEQHASTTAAMYLGIRRLRTRLQDVPVLPGAMMPWLFEIPSTMVPKGLQPVDRYDLTECYQLTRESYRDESYVIKRATEPGQLDQTGVRAVNLFDVVRLDPKYKPHPPGTPGFWDWNRWLRDGHASSARVKRGAARYAEAKGMYDFVSALIHQGIQGVPQ